MRILIVLISSLIGGHLLAQAETEIHNNSIEPAKNEFNIEVSEEELFQDSMLLDLDEEVNRQERRDFRKEKASREMKPDKKNELLVSPASEISINKYDSVHDESVPSQTPGAFGISTEGNAQDAIIPVVRGTEVYTTKSKIFSKTNERSNMQRQQRSPSYEQQLEMDAAVNYFEINDPSSFEYNYFKYTAGNYDVSLYPNLEVAELARPNNSDVHIQMAGYYMIKDESDSALVYMDKLIDSERLTTNVVEYASDVLRSVPEEGILITHGFDDSYGAYYAQQKNEIRTDVTLMSLDFMQSEFYRESLEDEGYKLPKSEVINVGFLNAFCAMNADKNLSIALTTPKEYFKPMKGKLFIVGLVFEYHKDTFDNFYSNDYLWNEQFTKDLIANPVDEKGKQLSANYLPMLLYLRKVYAQKGEDAKKDEMDRVTDQIGVQSNKYEQVQKVKAAY